MSQEGAEFTRYNAKNKRAHFDFRKTGIVIEDTGERNEHGFERMDAFFSPTTTPGRTVGERTPNGRGYESDIGDETDVRATDASAPMDIASMY